MHLKHREDKDMKHHLIHIIMVTETEVNNTDWVWPQ